MHGRTEESEILGEGIYFISRSGAIIDKSGIVVIHAIFTCGKLVGKPPGFQANCSSGISPLGLYSLYIRIILSSKK